jgi:acyl-coenzyme A synthetase/AMP-(fatty) acid ligase
MPAARCPLPGSCAQVTRSARTSLCAHAGKFAGRLQDVPERILLEELPKGLTGKVDRRSLRDILIAQPDLLKQRVVARV